jgi:hypothetical protein
MTQSRHLCDFIVLDTADSPIFVVLFQPIV